MLLMGRTTSVLKTVEPELKLAGLTGLMVDRFKPVNKSNRSASLLPNRPVWSQKAKTL
jgi:hypothetical protein